MVALSLRPRAAVVDPGQQAAGRITRHLVGGDVVGELVRVGVLDLNAVECLAIDAVGLAADGVADVCCCHQVAFIGSVNEHSPHVFLARKHLDRGDAAIIRGHAATGAVQPLVAVDRDCVVADEVFKNLFGDVRLKDPHRPALTVHRRRALAAVAIGGPVLPSPGGGLVVVGEDPLVEVERNAADHRLVATVSPAKAPGGEAPQVFIGTNDDRTEAHLLGLHGGGDPGTGWAVDHEVVGSDGFSPEKPHAQTANQERRQETGLPIPHPKNSSETVL